MPGQNDYIFVLWADRFDEAAASLFITEFRKAGLKAKLVGLSGYTASGAHGLALSTDLTLDQALPLAYQASCVVAPCGPAALRRLGNDPRLIDLLDKARLSQALFVVPQAGAASLASITGWKAGQAAPLGYPDSQDLVDFVQRLANQLAASRHAPAAKPVSTVSSRPKL